MVNTKIKGFDKPFSRGTVAVWYSVKINNTIALGETLYLNFDSYYTAVDCICVIRGSLPYSLIDYLRECIVSKKPLGEILNDSKAEQIDFTTVYIVNEKDFL